MNANAQIALHAGEGAKPVSIPATVGAVGIVASNQLSALTSQ